MTTFLLNQRACFVLLACLAMTELASPAAAFCIYNSASEDVTVLAWPAGGKSFKAVISPGGQSCCNWQDDTCIAKAEADSESNPLGQCASVHFYMTPRNLDTNQITSKLVAKEALTVIGKVIDIIGKALSVVPDVGEAIDAVATLTSAGIDVTDEALTDIIEFTSNDRFVNGQNGGAITWNDQNHISGNKGVGC
ncbi:TPA: hypothetical protein ACH3X3_012937 [Trebouxia sp. C0006]